ncbi:MAG: hypothetical protein IPN72_15440 [Saprospiraceae bacterium]|nr:hypothetical protein [Saprospiraceae bacterium]HMS68702.1 hypothetical protein [Saprospiraceae bacterium]
MMFNKCLICFLLFTSCTLWSQKYLQLETINDPQTLKYTENDKLTFRSVSLPDWQSRRIERLVIPDSLVIFNDGFMKLDQFDAIQTTRPIVGIAGKGFMTFGVAWGVFGIIDELYNPGKQIDTKTVVIGSTSFLVGYGLQKLFYKRTHKLGKRYRLRLLDLSIK